MLHLCDFFAIVEQKRGSVKKKAPVEITPQGLGKLFQFNTY